MKVSKICILVSRACQSWLQKYFFEWLSIQKGTQNSYRHNKKSIGLNC